MLVFCVKLVFAAPKWPKSNCRLREINPSIRALTSFFWFCFMLAVHPKHLLKLASCACRNSILSGLVKAPHDSLLIFNGDVHSSSCIQCDVAGSIQRVQKEMVCPLHW